MKRGSVLGRHTEFWLETQVWQDKHVISAQGRLRQEALKLKASLITGKGQESKGKEKENILVQ